MIENCPVIVDSFCEINPMFESIVDDRFYDFAQHTMVPGAIYVVSRQQMIQYVSVFKELADQGTIKIVLVNPAEGADTMYWQARTLGLLSYLEQRKILIVSGAKMHSHSCMVHEHLFTQAMNYEENRRAMYYYRARWSTQRPYKFLFLNGRMRTHRKYLLERFRASGILNQSLWTNLDPRTCHGFRDINWYASGCETLEQRMDNEDWLREPFPVKSLPAVYEFDRYREKSNISLEPSSEDMYVKKSLFGADWGEIYLEALPYLDTYFSVVTETTFDYTECFRTEKISKPLAIGHPWIAAAAPGFYREIKNMGFQTFDHLIDESFDSIVDPLSRVKRIAEVVEDLCQQDLASFVSAANSVCLHNQQHLGQLQQELKEKFIDRFSAYVKENFEL